jgi:uncharacterized SAM-binding protein YcdF (DUF218 family)
MSVLKLLLERWLLPLPICLVLLIAGLSLRRGGRARAANIAFALSAALGLLSAYGPLANGLLRPLESRYPAVLDASILNPAPHYIVVLGSGYRPRPGLPVTAALDADSLVRLFEAVRLWRELPGAVLVLSGGAIRGEPPIARGYATAASALGIPADAMLLSDLPVDTGSEIRALRQQVGEAPVLLVTSAAHMPRAMALCARYGVHALAAPTGNLTEPNPGARAWLALPSAGALHRTESAIHEYLGLLALRFGVS